MKNLIKLNSCALALCLLANGAFASAHKNYAWGSIRNDIGHCLTKINDKVLAQPCLPSKEMQKILYTGMQTLMFLDQDSEASKQCIALPSGSGAGIIGLEPKINSCGDDKGQNWVITLNNANGNASIKSVVNNNYCLQSDGQKIIINNCNPLEEKQAFNLGPDYAFSRSFVAARGIYTQSWMEQIYGKEPDTLLKDIIIPGTHDSGTDKDFSKISTTQDISIYQQLLAGVRYIDLRVGTNDTIIHGLESGPTGTFSAALNEILSFAKAHPKEIIFVDFHEIPTAAKDTVIVKDIINKTIKPRLVDASTPPSQLSFAKVWAKPDTNIVMLMRTYQEFNDSTDDELKTLMYDKSLNEDNDAYFTNSNNPNWGEVWPNSTNFVDIENKTRTGIMHRDKDKWHMSQLIRTPSIGNAITSTLFGGIGSPFDLSTQTTSDGVFDLQIDKWVYDWKALKLPVNFVATDFIDRTNLVWMALLLNLEGLDKK